MILRSTPESHEQLTDEILAARMAKGQAGALETLYDHYAPMVLGIALKITNDRALAEQVLEETFWRAWQSAVTYQPQRGSFSSWLFRIARELARDAGGRASSASNH